jgi:hypothetical protein
VSCGAIHVKSYVLKDTVCSFRWIVVAESTVRWFIVREKHCWMAADSADMLKRTRRVLLEKLSYS